MQVFGYLHKNNTTLRILDNPNLVTTRTNYSLKKLIHTLFKNSGSRTPSAPSIFNNSDRLQQEFVRILYDVMILASFNKDTFEIVDIKLMNKVLKQLSMENLNKEWLLNRIMIHQNQPLKLEDILLDFSKHMSLEQQELVVQAALIITRTDRSISEKNLQLLIGLGKIFDWEPSILKAFITKAL